MIFFAFLLVGLVTFLCGAAIAYTAVNERIRDGRPLVVGDDVYQAYLMTMEVAEEADQ